MVHRVSQEQSSSCQRSSEQDNDNDEDDQNGNSNDGGYEDDGLSDGTSGESEEPDLRITDSRYGEVLKRLERGNDLFRGNDGSQDEGDGERNVHDWLGRNDFVVHGEYHIGEVFLLTVTTPLYWKYNRRDGTFRHEYLDTSSQDRHTHCRVRMLVLRRAYIVPIFTATVDNDPCVRFATHFLVNTSVHDMLLDRKTEKCFFLAPVSDAVVRCSSSKLKVP